jgi:hypothetical protein
MALPVFLSECNTWSDGEEEHFDASGNPLDHNVNYDFRFFVVKPLGVPFHTLEEYRAVALHNNDKSVWDTDAAYSVVVCGWNVRGDERDAILTEWMNVQHFDELAAAREVGSIAPALACELVRREAERLERDGAVMDNMEAWKWRTLRHARDFLARHAPEPGQP